MAQLNNKKHIVILGGGTAGWMSATLLRHTLPKDTFSISLIESPNIGTIGVGEGSTPHLKQFFDLLGVNESDWMPKCHATFKNGISFVNWTKENHDKETSYFHPFPSIVDRQTAGAFLHNCLARHKGVNQSVNPNHYFLAHTLSQHGFGPKTKPGKPSLPMNYAYHFDSNLLGAYLCTLGKKMGVRHIQGEYEKSLLDSNGNIDELVLKDKRSFNGDFFIDASGFSALLTQKALQQDFKSFSDNLFNDSAIAIPTGTCSKLLAQTTATALKYGWAWHIPLSNRTGNGYVFSSHYCNFDEAENELRQHLGICDESNTIKRIKMKVGHVSQPWCKNVLAVGLAQGFIEPLEATALHLVMDSLTTFLHSFRHMSFEQTDIDHYNHQIISRYNGIRDYIVCHYKVNNRTDSQYWIDCASNTHISENLSAVLLAWRAGQDITPILEQRNMNKYYSAISWYCLLAGYDYYDKKATGVSTDQTFERLQKYLQATSQQFQSHKDLINSYKAQNLNDV